MLLNNQWVSDQIKTEIKQYMETNENNSAAHQLLWDAVKAEEMAFIMLRYLLSIPILLRAKCITILAYLKNEEQSQMNSLNEQLLKLEKENKWGPKSVEGGT